MKNLVDIFTFGSKAMMSENVRTIPESKGNLKNFRRALHSPH